ncbi:hypothetical protein GCM10009412_36890 [Aeromonas salmonicida subsp. achromogenes]
MHSVSSKANWGAIVGSKLGKMCERAHALTGKRRRRIKETFVLRKLCVSSHSGGPTGPQRQQMGDPQVNQ